MTPEHDSASIKRGIVNDRDPLTGRLTGRLAVECRCGWRAISTRNASALNTAAIDHQLGRRDDRAPLGFSPVVDLDLEAAA